MSAPVDDVSDNINWTTRVTKELTAEKDWYDNGWGEIFARDMPRDPGDKVAMLQKELNRFACGGRGLHVPSGGPSPPGREHALRSLERSTGSAWKTTHRAQHAERSRKLEVFGRSKHARATAKDLTPANPYYD